MLRGGTEIVFYRIPKKESYMPEKILYVASTHVSGTRRNSTTRGREREREREREKKKGTDGTDFRSLDMPIVTSFT